MTKSMEKDQVRRQKILEAATRVFERDGLSKASMRVIAQEAGCTTGAIYPIFSGKEDIYASLLEDSLDRLYTAVAKASAPQADAIDGLISAAQSFFEYYVSKRFELDLGLYLFGSEKPKSLGRERDDVLNARLLQTLDIFGACFQRLAPPFTSEDQKISWAQQERDALFTILIGTLMLAHTGRDISIGTNAEAVLKTYLKAIQDRLKNNTVTGDKLCR